MAQAVGDCMAEGEAEACGEPVPRAGEALEVGSSVPLGAAEALASAEGVLGGGVGVSARDAETAPVLPLGEAEGEGERVRVTLGEAEAVEQEESCGLALLGVEDSRGLPLALAVGVVLRELEGEAEGVRGAEADGLAEAQ